MAAHDLYLDACLYDKVHEHENRPEMKVLKRNNSHLLCSKFKVYHEVRWDCKYDALQIRTKPCCTTLSILAEHHNSTDPVDIWTLLVSVAGPETSVLLHSCATYAWAPWLTIALQLAVHAHTPEQ